MRTARLLIAAIILPFHAGSAQPTDVGMFRGGAAHLGEYALPSPTLGTLAWKFRTEGRVVSSPVVIGETVFVGSSDGNLYALNRGDGSLRWKFATKGAVNSSPAVARGLVFVSSLDGRVYAIDASTGKQ